MEALDRLAHYPACLKGQGNSTKHSKQRGKNAVAANHDDNGKAVKIDAGLSHVKLRNGADGEVFLITKRTENCLVTLVG